MEEIILPERIQRQVLFIGLPWWLRWERICPAMWETQVLSLGQEDPVEKGMATHSSILARRILWTEEPDGLQSTLSQRVRHDWATNTSTYSFKHRSDRIWLTLQGGGAGCRAERSLSSPRGFSPSVPPSWAQLSAGRGAGRGDKSKWRMEG